MQLVHICMHLEIQASCNLLFFQPQTCRPVQINNGDLSGKGGVRTPSTPPTLPPPKFSPASHTFPAPDINEANMCIMHTSIGSKLFICKLDYCLKVYQPSTNAKKMGNVYVFALNFQ